MDCYAASDATAEAKAIDAKFGGRGAAAYDEAEYGSTSQRVPVEVYPGPATGVGSATPVGLPGSLACTLRSHATRMPDPSSKVLL